MIPELPIRLPVGVRDFLPPAAARRRAIAEALIAEFERWGYDRIITPAFEYAAVLARALGDAASLRFVEPATGEVVALRTDITPQIARIAATRLGEARGPVRLAYEGSVLRLLPGARGQRELIQAGVELIDGPSPAGDAEMIALAGAALAAAEIGDVTIDVGHVALARGALAGMGPEIQELVARKDRGGLERAVGSSPAAAVLVALPGLYGEAADVFARARALPLDDTMARAVDELEAALELAREQGFAGRLTVDLGEIRGSGYYTGIRFAAYVDGVGDAVLTGGRYDDLVGRYGRAARATGFAVDVEAIAQAEHARGGEPSPAARGVVVACPGDPRSAARVAAALRRRNLRVAVDLARREDDAALLAYLAERGARAAVVCDRGGARLLPGAKAISPTAWERAEAGDATLLAAEIVAAQNGRTD